MKKKVKKLSRNLVSLMLVSLMMLSYFAPIAEVFAVDTVVTFTVSVADESDATLFARGESGKLATGVAGDGLAASRGENSEIIVGIDDTFTNTGYANDKITVTCATDKSCTVSVSVPEEHGVKVTVGGDSPISFRIGEQDYFSEPIANGATITVINKDVTDSNFDGSAYLVWSCKEGTCYSLVEGLSNSVKYIVADTILSATNGSKFDISAETKGFVIAADFTEWQTYYKTFYGVSSIDWSKLDANLVLNPMLGDMRQYEQQAEEYGACSKTGVAQETFERCVDNYVSNALKLFNHPVGLRPVGEPYSNNAYVSYGDRNFKVIVYNEEYRGLTIGSLNDLHYYPSTWTDEMVRIDAYDISDTTKEDPAVIDAVILEKTINLKALGDFNAFTIKKVEALDIPEGAVDIRFVDGEYKITFSSNFYDKVVFKITDTEDKEYFVRINRFTLELDRDEIHYRDGETNDYDIKTKFYFDRETSYSDYVLTAKIEYTDGTSKVVEMVNAREIDNGMGDKVYAPEIDDQENPSGPHNGRGLKIAAYKLTIKNADVKNISRVFINVEMAGSTAENYEGAFAGSGKGVVINFVEETNHD